MRVLIVGAGIIGLATAARLAERGDEVLEIGRASCRERVF